MGTNVSQTLRQHFDSLGNSLKKALDQARNIDAPDLQKTLQAAADRFNELDERADDIFDKGLRALEKSKATPYIVVGIVLGIAVFGFWLGWSTK